MQHIRPTTGLLDDRDEDWRDTLFYWHGRVTWVGGERNVVSWRGSWLSTVASHAPPAADFSSSFNFFELNFDVDPMRARQFATGDMDLRVHLGVPRCCGAFTPSTRLVSIRRGRGWFIFEFGPKT